MSREFKDPNYLVKLEKAISKKQDKLNEQNEKVEVDGVLISKKLLNREYAKRNCPVCKEYSFDLKDDAYMSKYECCLKCYIKFIQGMPETEEKWLTGWRPKRLQEKN